jgi:hypothetical protein
MARLPSADGSSFACRSKQSTTPDVAVPGGPHKGVVRTADDTPVAISDHLPHKRQSTIASVLAEERQGCQM